MHSVVLNCVIALVIAETKLENATMAVRKKNVEKSEVWARVTRLLGRSGKVKEEASARDPGCACGQARRSEVEGDGGQGPRKIETWKSKKLRFPKNFGGIFSFFLGQDVIFGTIWEREGDLPRTRGAETLTCVVGGQGFSFAHTK